MKADVEAMAVEEKKPVRDLSKVKVPAGCTLMDMIRPVREAVPNATVRLPKRIIDSDLTCAICMNIISEAMIISDCLHRFCSDCIGQCLRLSKRECPSCRTPVTRHQLMRDADFDLIISKMYSDVSGLRDMQDVQAAEFCTSDNIKVISEDLKERLEQQVQLTAAGGRSLVDSPSNAPDSDNNVRAGPGFMSENAQLRPSHFVRLKENEYPGEADSAVVDPPECECFYVEGTGGCKADCSNRKNRRQCNPATCPCGTGCTNILFKYRTKDGNEAAPVGKSVKLGVFNTPNKGWALKALEEVDPGRLIEEVLGECLTLTEIGSRLITPKRRAAAKTPASHFLIYIDHQLYLDLTDKGSLARFVNHSPSPNCELQVWDVLGEKRVGLFALKPIRKDSELTVDYSCSHVGEKGIENHCEQGARGSKVQKQIPFKKYVEDVLRMASEEERGGGRGVVSEEAKMVVHVEEDSGGRKKSDDKPSWQTGNAGERAGELQRKEGCAEEGVERRKTDGDVVRAALIRPDQEGGGVDGAAPPEKPMISHSSVATHLSTSTMNLHDALLAMPKPGAGVPGMHGVALEDLGRQKAAPAEDGVWRGRGSGTRPGSAGSIQEDKPMLKDNQAMTVAEILEEWGILDAQQAEQVSHHMRSRGVSVRTAINTLFEHVTNSLLDRAIKRREEALEYLSRARNARGEGGLSAIGSAGESVELKATIVEMQRKIDQMQQGSMQQGVASSAGRDAMAGARHGGPAGHVPVNAVPYVQHGAPKPNYPLSAYQQRHPQQQPPGAPQGWGGPAPMQGAGGAWAGSIMNSTPSTSCGRQNQEPWANGAAPQQQHDSQYQHPHHHAHQKPYQQQQTIPHASVAHGRVASASAAPSVTVPPPWHSPHMAPQFQLADRDRAARAGDMSDRGKGDIDKGRSREWERDRDRARDDRGGGRDREAAERYRDRERGRDGDADRRDRRSRSRPREDERARGKDNTRERRGSRSRSRDRGERGRNNGWEKARDMGASRRESDEQPGEDASDRDRGYGGGSSAGEADEGRRKREREEKKEELKRQVGSMVSKRLSGKRHLVSDDFLRDKEVRSSLASHMYVVGRAEANDEK